MDQGNRTLLVSELVYESYNQNDRIHKYMHAFEFGVTRRIETEEVRKALQILMHYQSVLKMKIVRKSNLDFTFQVLNDAELENYVPIEEEETEDFDASWIRLAEREGSIKGFDRLKGLLWKVIFMRITNCTHFGLLFILHHGICDARSVFDFVYRQLLPVLSYVTNQENVPPQFTDNVLPLCPTPEEIMFESRENAIKLVQRPSFLQRQVCNFIEWMTSRMTLEDKRKVTYLADLNGSVYWEGTNYVEFVTYSYSPLLTQALTTTCKKHNVTVHAVLLTAAAKALVMIARENTAQPPPPRGINLSWQICRRSVSGLQSPQPLGVMVTNGAAKLTVVNSQEINVENFWKDATHVTEKCRKSMPKSNVSFVEKTSSAFLGAMVSKALLMDESMFSIMGKAAGMMHVVISNLGLCEKIGSKPVMCSGDVKVQLEKQYFGINGSIDMHGGGSVFQCVSTFQGCMRWNLCISKRWVSRERALHYMRRVEDILREACSCAE